jgi:hypothetical protein
MESKSVAAYALVYLRFIRSLTIPDQFSGSRVGTMDFGDRYFFDGWRRPSSAFSLEV